MLTILMQQKTRSNNDLPIIWKNWYVTLCCHFSS